MGTCTKTPSSLFAGAHVASSLQGIRAVELDISRSRNGDKSRCDTFTQRSTWFSARWAVVMGLAPLLEAPL